MTQERKSSEASGMDTPKAHQGQEAFKALQKQRLSDMGNRVTTRMLGPLTDSESVTVSVNTGGSVEESVSEAAPEATSATSTAEATAGATVSEPATGTPTDTASATSPAIPAPEAVSALPDADFKLDQAMSGQPDTNTAYANTGGRTGNSGQRVLNMRRAANRKSQSGGVRETVAPVRQDVGTVGAHTSSVDRGRVEQGATWNRDRLFAEIKEGGIFTLFDSNGTPLPGEYIRKGGKFLKGKNKSKDHWKDIIRILSQGKGGEWKPKGGTVTDAPKLASAEVLDSVVPATPTPALLDTSSPAERTGERELIVGRYYDTRDGQKVLCQVYRDENEYGYEVLDGDDRGSKITVGDAGKLRALLKDSWQKVDDATAPKSGDIVVTTVDSALPADASVPEATPSPAESAPGEALRFTPLNKGEQVVYSGKEGRVKVTGLGSGRYKIEGAGGEIIDDDCDEERVRNLAREEEWTPDVIPTVNDVMEPKGFRLLPDGGRAHYIVTATNEVIVVERDKDDYIVSRGGNYIPYSEADIVALAEGEKWQWYADGLRDQDFTPGESAPVSEPATPAETGPEQSELAKLEAEVKEARLEYVRTDYHQKKLWTRIASVLPFLRDKARHDNDTEDARKRYESALSSLDDYKLGEFKKLPLSLAERSKKMGGMLMYLQKDELANLAIDRTKVQSEHMNVPKKVMEKLEGIGKRYNQLKPIQKIALAIAVFGGAAAAGAAAGAVGATVGLSAVTVRRIITTLGAGASLDMLTAQWVEERQKNKAIEELKEDMVELVPLTSVGTPEASMDEQLQKYKELSERDIKSLDRKFQRQKLINKWRKGAIWATAVGASAFFTYKSFDGMSAGAGSAQDNYRARLTRALDQTQDDGTLASPEGGASAPGTGASAPGMGASGAETGRGGVQGATSQESSVRPISHRERVAFLGANGVPVDEAGNIDQARSALLERAGTVLKDYTVEASDGKRGLWGILDRRLPDTMPKGPGRDQMIAKIEALMRQDLAKMTLAQQAEAGFPKGNLDLIYEKGVIRFDKFPSLTPERLADIVDGEPVSVSQGAGVASGSGGAPSTIPDVVSAKEKAKIIGYFVDQPKVSAEPANAPMNNLLPDDAEKQRLSNYRTGGVGEGGVRGGTESAVPQGADGVARETVIMTPAEVVRPENFRVFLEQNPELAHSHRITLSGIKTATFSMPDAGPQEGKPYMAPIDGGYDLSKHGRVYMGRVLEWKQDFVAGRMAPHEFDRGDYPLRTTQVDRLLHLIRVATHGTIFGEAGRPLPDETIDRYLNRMAALTTITGKEALLAKRLGFGK